MALTYATYQAELSAMITIPTTDTGFIAILPGCIDYAEQRIYRELDLLATVVRDATGSLSASSRNFTLPTPAAGSFVSVDSVNVVTPAATAPDSGTRVPLMKTSVDFIDFLAPSTSTATVPAAFAMVTNQTLIVGPVPSAAYRLEIIGTIRPTPLSASNTSTILTAQLPDMFLAASMVFMSGYMKNFGAQADDVKMAQSWETQYQTLKASADVEELRKKYTSFTGRTVAGTPRAA